MELTRDQVLAHRLRAHQLDREAGHDITDTAILDLGIQNTGPDGVGWALANRGVSLPQAADPGHDLALAWTLRGAPHAYRREDIGQVAAAVAPFSDADAAKRIFDAAKPLREAGIGPLEALDAVARQMSEIVTEPTAKGDMSGRLRERMSRPYLRFCRACNAIHLYEQPFRLSALQAGLELQPGTSPPVLQPIAGWMGQESPDERFNVIRACLRFFGPSTPKQVAAYLDAPVKDVKERWPADAVRVSVGGGRLSALESDVEAMASSDPVDVVRLLSPFDPYLQARDRELVIPGEAHRKELWVTLGRPGAILVGNEIVGTWRPKAAGKKLALTINAWSKLPEDGVAEQAERLAAWRGVTFTGLA